MDKTKFKEGFQKYTMIIVLVLVTIFFAWGTQGKILLPQNINNLISQNAYVFVLATGMLLCILTGGNIDLSVGSVVCFVGALCGIFMENMNLPDGVAIILALLIGTLIGSMAGILDRLCKNPSFYCYTGRNARCSVGCPTWFFREKHCLSNLRFS